MSFSYQLADGGKCNYQPQYSRKNAQEHHRSDFNHDVSPLGINLLAIADSLPAYHRSNDETPDRTYSVRRIRVDVQFLKLQHWSLADRALLLFA